MESPRQITTASALIMMYLLLEAGRQPDIVRHRLGDEDDVPS
jgi:metal-dependent HD superfamily phosphatase/phosphodiesterase